MVFSYHTVYIFQWVMMFYQFQEGVDVRVARIFNTFGPRMHMADGRVVSNFILQALQNEPITVSVYKWIQPTGGGVLGKGGVFTSCGLKVDLSILYTPLLSNA